MQSIDEVIAINDRTEKLTVPEYKMDQKNDGYTEYNEKAWRQDLIGNLLDSNIQQQVSVEIQSFSSENC